MALPYDEKLLASNQQHADAIAKAAQALNVAIRDAYDMHLDIDVRVLEFSDISHARPRPQVEVTVMMPLKGRA